jgi:histone H3/H4
MALTEAQIFSIFKKSKIAYSKDAIRAIGTLNITDVEIADKMTKAAFYNAAKFNRKIVTAEDIEKVAAEMHR